MDVEKPGGKTRNEIDYIITNKTYIIKDVTVLNSFTTGSDHRMVRATVEINIRKERNKMIKEKKVKVWAQPKDEQKFVEYINKELKEISTNDINKLNNSITNIITEAQLTFCAQDSKEERISSKTKNKMENRRELLKDKNIRQQEINSANKEISKAIRRDIRRYKNDKIIQTIEKNRNMKVLRRKLTDGKKEIIRLKDKKGIVKSSREEMINIVEEFYETLYKNQLILEPEEHALLKITNQGSEDIPNFRSRNPLCFEENEKRQSTR